MIIRYGGGNNGIAEYLENGRKAEREYTRDELDHRLILDGDLLTTNKIIQSIEDKGQERYLHITLSFAEKEVSAETLKNIVSDYKQNLMNAFHEDEYSFYAEAHLPKIKNLVDNKTGELIERKPHIHIVLPRTNLVTNKSLNPTGDMTRSKTQEQLDAIQEHINNKYNLISPKDAVRVSDENYANVLSRVKGDLYRERNNDIKREIFDKLTKSDLKSTESFSHLLNEYGDVRVRNEGKPTEYFAVKFDGDSKYTNLKNPLFSRSFIESRQLPLVKPTPAQIEKNMTTWLEKTSHEIKHIFPKSEKIRSEYKSLNASEKEVFLKHRIQIHDRQNKLDSKSIERTRGRKDRNKSSPQSNIRFGQSEKRIGLSRMPQRGLVRGIRGRGQPANLDSPLPDFQQHHLAERMETGQRVNQEMRRELDRRFTERGIKNVEQSTALHESLYQKLNANAEHNEISTMADIRRDIDPERFLSAVSLQFNIKVSDHAISRAKDGSPRFSVEKRNLNASDFMTKYLNLSWKDTKDFLLKTYAQQLEDKPYEKAKTTTKLSHEQSKLRYVSLKDSSKSLREIIQIEKRNMYNELRFMRKEMFSIPKEDREVAKGVLVYKKLTTLETLAEMSSKGRNFISQYHMDWNEDKDSMKSIDKLKQALSRDEENGIAANDSELSLKAVVDAQKRIQEFQRTNVKLKDLVMDKHDKEIVYRDQTSEKAVFTDKGDFVVSGKPISKEEIGIMLDYSQEKFGGVLKLTGSDEFKKQVAQVAAEKNMNLILRPDQYQKIMLAAKAELEATQAPVQESAPEQTVSKDSVEEQPAVQQEAARDEITPTASPTPDSQAQSHQNAPEAQIYFVKFNNADLDKNITGFATLSHAVDWRNLNANLHDTNKQDAIIYRVDERIADQKGLNGLEEGDAQPLARHEIEKAQGKDVNEQDGKILDVIDRYQAKSESEGIEFNRDAVEGDLLNRDLTVDVAEERLEKQYTIDKTEKEQNQEQER